MTRLSSFLGVGPYLSRRALENGGAEEFLEAAVYYPGVIDPLLATPLELHVGENPSGFDFTTASGRLPAHRIRGKIINSVTGQPAGNASIVVVPRTEDSVLSATAVSAPDGSFEVKGVATGSYFVLAALYPAGGMGNALANSGIASTRVPIEIGDKDLDNLPIVVVPNFKIPVRLVFEGETLEPPETVRGSVTLTRWPTFDFPFRGSAHVTKFVADGVGEEYRRRRLPGPG